MKTPSCLSCMSNMPSPQSSEVLRAPSRQDVLYPPQLPEAKSGFDPLAPLLSPPPPLFFNRGGNDSQEQLVSGSELCWGKRKQAGKSRFGKKNFLQRQEVSQLTLGSITTGPRPLKEIVTI